MEEKLNKLITDVEVIKTKVEMMSKNYPCSVHTDTMQDHEDRIRQLESFKNKFYGAIIVGNILTGIIVSVVVALISK